MAHRWTDFDGPAAMALAGPYDLNARQETPGRVHWWLNSATGFHWIKRGVAETMPEAKAAAEAAYADFMAFAARLRPLDVAAILAAQQEDGTPSLAPLSPPNLCE